MFTKSTHNTASTVKFLWLTLHCDSNSGSSYQDNADVDVSGASLARTAQLRHNPVSDSSIGTSMPHDCYIVLLCHDAHSTMKISHCQETHDHTLCYATFDIIDKEISVGM